LSNFRTKGVSCGSAATVIILPVVRIERHDDPHMADAEPGDNPPADNSGRRRVRRR
jgi:hypothetical protein